MRLSAFDGSTGALARRVMALLRECPTSNAQLSQDCLKLLNNLLKRHAAFTPTDAQFRFIVSRAFGDLEGEQREEQRSTTFSLMRAVLARRPLLPEIYDMMKTVSSLVVRANAAETRALCAQALVQFLLDYPLGGGVCSNTSRRSPRTSSTNTPRDASPRSARSATSSRDSRARRSRRTRRFSSCRWWRAWARTRMRSVGARRASRYRVC